MTRSQKSMLTEPYVVAIAGASGSGKSCLAERLRDRLSATDGSQHVRMLCEDAYYRDRSDLTYEQRCGINYDHPESLEHKLLVDHLDALRAGSVIEAPSYDYATHNRRTSTETVEPCRILLLEGILLLSQPAIRERCDLKLFVDVPLDVCLSRRVRRDVLDRGRTVENVLQQYEATVRPMFHQFIEPSKSFADLIIPEGGENERAADVLAMFLASRQ